MDLIQTLVDSLGVSEAQARGGAGALFQQAKAQLDSEAVAQLESAVPDLNTLIADAPAQAEGGLAGALGGLSSVLGGGSKVAGLGSVVNAFSALGLDSGMVARFVPIILRFVEARGGSELRAILAKVLA